MFSPKAFLHEIITKNLSEWVENIQEDSFHLGLLEGDIQLSNLAIKKKTWGLNQNLSLSLEYGTIDKFSAQVPWLQLHTGQVNIFVDTVVLIFRINLLDHDKNGVKGGDNFTHELKMDLLQKEELRLSEEQGVSANSKGSKTSWMSRSMTSVLNSFISKIASNFNLTATNIKVSLLLPLPQHESAQLKLNVRSLIVSSDISSADRNRAASSARNSSGGGLFEFFLTKDVQIRGLSVTLNRVVKPSTQRDFVSLSKNKSHDTVGVLLNPCNSSTQVFGRKDKNRESYLQNLNTLSVHLSVSNMEWTPSCDQLFLLKDVVSHLEQEEIKFRYQAIRALILKKPNPLTTGENTPISNANFTPAPTPLHQRTKSGMSQSSNRQEREKIPFNAREVWLFAIRAILVMVKERNSGGKFTPQLRSGMERLGLRRQYLALHRKVMDAKLSRANGTSSTTAPSSSSVPASADVPLYSSQASTKSVHSSISASAKVEPKEILEIGLNSVETKRYAELHSLFSLSDLVLFRATVLQEYQNKGVSSAELRRALTNKHPNTIWSQWFGGRTAGPGRPAESAGSSKFASSESCSSSEPPVIIEENNSNFTFELKGTLSRLSITIYDNPLEPHHPNNRVHASDGNNLHYSTPATSLPPRSSTGASAYDGQSNKNGESSRKNVRRHGGNFSIKTQLQTRVGQTIRATPGTAHSTTTSVHAGTMADALVLPKQCFSLVFYGIHTAFEWAGDNDKIVVFSLGSLKCFGHKGTEIVSCGGDPNYWLEYNFLDAQDGEMQQQTSALETDTSKALSLSLKWCHTAVMTTLEQARLEDLEARERHKKHRRRTRGRTSSNMTNSTNDETNSTASDTSEGEEDEEEDEEEIQASLRKARTAYGLTLAADKYTTFDGDRSFSAQAMSSVYKDLMRASNKHLVVEISVSYLHLTWHKKSAMFITDLYFHLAPNSSQGSSTTPFQNLKDQGALLSYYRAARGIVDVPAKVSIEASSRGLTIQIPIQGGDSQSSAQRRNSKFGAGTFTAPRKPFENTMSASQANMQHQREQEAATLHHRRYVQLSIGKIRLAAGDYLTDYLTAPRPAPAPLQDHIVLDESIQEGNNEYDPDALRENFSSENLHAESTGHSEPNYSAPPSSSNVRRSGHVQRRSSSYDTFGSEGNDPQTEEAPEEPAFVPLTTEEKIRELVLALRNAAVRPMAFSVANVELCIVGNESAPSGGLDGPRTQNSLHQFFLSVPVNPPEGASDAEGEEPTDEAGNAKRMLTAVPWMVHGVISPSVVPANSAFTSMRVDLICSPFKMLLSTEDIISLIDMLKGMAAVCAPVVADATTGPVAPRIRRLSPLSCLFLDVEMEELGIEFLVARKGSTMSNSSAIAAALRTYGSLVQARGRYSYVSMSRRPVVCSQLRSLGVEKADALSVLTRFENDIVESRHDVEYIADLHTMGLYGKADYSPNSPSPIFVMGSRSSSRSPAPKGNAERIAGLPDTCRAVLFHLRIFSLRFLHHSLTYDEQSLVTIGSLILFDKERVPLLTLSKDLSDRLEHFPHLDKDAPKVDEMPGIDLRSNSAGRSSARRRDSSSRRDSTASLHSRSQDRVYPRDRRNSNTSRKSRRFSSARDSPPDTRYSRNSVADNLEQLENPEGVFITPSYSESFRIDRYASTCALALKYEEKDVNEHFGEGGWGIDVLYKPMEADLYGVRDGFVTLNSRQVEIQFCTNSILQIFQQAVEAASIVRSHYTEEVSALDASSDPRDARKNSTAARKRSTSTNFYDPTEKPRAGRERDTRRRRSSFAQMAMTRERFNLHASIGGRLSKIYVHQYLRRICLKADVGALTVVLSCEKLYLAQLSIYRISAAVQDLVNLEGNRTMTAAIHSLSLIDLSEAGALHSEVLWKNNDNQSLNSILEGIKAAEKENYSAHMNASNSEYLYRESSRRINELFKLEKARIDDAPPVIALSFTQSEAIVHNQKRQKMMLNMEVDALRVTFLFRFILDMVVYFKDKLVVPLKASLASMEESTRRLSAVPAPLKYNAQDSDLSDASYESDIDLDSISDDSLSDNGDNYSWSGESVSDEDEAPRGTRYGRRGGNSPGLTSTPAESSGNESGVEPDEKKMEVLTNFELVLTATDLAGVVPRSSSSRDLIGLKVGHGTVRIGFVADSFPLPAKDGVFPGLNPVESDAEFPLHLDVATNSWRYKPSLATARAKSRVAAQSNLDALMRRSFSPTFSTSSRQRDRALSGNSLNSGHGSGGTASGAATAHSRGSAEDEKDAFTEANIHASQSMSHEWSADYDHSTLKDWGDAASVNGTGGSRWRPSLSGGINIGGESTWWLHDDEEERERLFFLEELANNDLMDNFDPKDCLRISASVTGARAFVTFAGPSNYRKEESAYGGSNKTDGTPMRKRSYSEAPSNMGGFGSQPVIDTTEHKVFMEIADGGLVNKFRRKAGGSVGVWPINQAWREVTLQEFNLLVVIDFTGDDKLKLLFGDTADMSTLRVQASQSEFYLLLDLWFSNCCELAQFGVTPNRPHSSSSAEVPVSPPPALSTPGASLDHRDRESGREKETVRFNVQASDSEGATPMSSKEHAGFIPVTPPRMGSHVPEHFMKYGSKEYLQFLRERFTTFEIVVMLAEVNLKASLDTNYYTRDLPNQAATAGMVPTDAGTAYTYHMGINAHHHHHAGHRVGVGRTPRGGEDAKHASGSKGARGGSGEDKMNFSFYNIPLEPHTPSFGKKAFVSRWVNKHLQLADIRLSGAMLHVQSDIDVLHLSVGAGKAEVYDMRHPQQICTPLALRVAPSDDPTTSDHVQNTQQHSHNPQKNHKANPAAVRRRVYGFSDLNFGFNLVPSSMYSAPDLPLKMSLLNSKVSNFLTLNVGMDLLDLNINNLDLVNLVSDYFSCYFRFPDYGHPGVQSYDRLTAPYIIPYGGVDTRVFVFRPHIAMLKAAMNLQSPALLLETDGGVYFRYTLDIENNVKMDLNIFSLAVILVKRYRPPSQYRGIRGSSGSGKGVRTLIEFLSLGMSYHFLVSGNNLDVKFFISGPENEDEDASQTDAVNESTAAINLSNEEVDTYVDLSDERLRLGSSAIPYPHSVYPLVPSRTDFTPHSCDVVASYEDLTFCVSLVNKFLNIKAAAKSRREKKKEKKRRENMDAFERARADSKDSVEEKEVNLVKPFGIFGVVSLAGLRLMVVDNVLGLHLPLVQVFLEEVQCTFVRDDHANMMIACASTEPVDRTSHLPYSLDSARDRNTRRFSREMSRRFSEAFRRDSLTVELVRLKNIAQYQLGLASTPSMYTTGGMLDAKAFAKQEVMTFVKFTVWAEYFNNMRKCWEPLLEKLVATVLYEKSLLRGTGLTVRTASAVHANISGAFFRTLNDILTTLRTHRGGKDSADESGPPDSVQNPTTSRPKAKRGSIHVPENTDHDYQYDDHHQHELGQQGAVPTLSTQHSLEKKKSDRMSLDRNGRPWSQRRKSRYSESFTRRSSINKDMGDDASSQNSGATVQRKLDHVPSNPLSANFRVGFSIQNLTGQPVRYLQQWEGGRRTVQYINNDERGLLNFVASKTLIRNNQVIEETFDVQMELSGEHYGARNRRKAVGNRVALQVSGYRWLHAVQADELGVHYEELYSVLGRVHASQVFKNWKVVNSLKLMVEVMPYAGGRMLRLRSVFTIKNNTRHRLKILAKEGTSTASTIGDNEKAEDSEAPFLLESGENFYVPLALLRRSVLASQGKSLGYLYLCPADLSSIEEELVSRPNSQPGSVEYTTDPINLYQTVSKSSEQENEHDPQHMGMDGDFDFTVKPDRLYAKDNYTQLVCHINPKIKSRYGNGRKSGTGDWQNNTDFQQQVEVRRTAARAALNKLPPFCYCVEVQSGTDYTNSQQKGANQGHHGNKNNFFSNMMNHNPKLNSPVNFTITIHPPIVLENLLPCSGIFELVHATQKRVLWSSFIAAGTAKPVHTVTLEEPLLLLINLKYCRSSEGALIHQPRRFESSEGIVGKMQRTLEGLLEDTANLGGEGSEDITSIVLTDTVGQRIRVNVENTLGGGGQRQIAVYCPYWVVNTSQYSLRIMEDGTNVLPAGTVTAQKDGTRPVPHSGSAFAEMQARNALDPESQYHGAVPNTLASPGGYLSPNAAGVESFHNIGQKKAGRSDANVGGAVFPGCYGPLHSINNKEFAIDSALGHQLQELSFNDTVDLSYMFNYIEPQGRLNKKRVKVQLDDTTWSRPFSLDSVGVDQMLTVNDHIRGCMEMGFKISVAPGRLAKYTKIVRFLPRFSLVNKLPVNVKILQPTGFAGEAAEVEVSAERVRPYHLPAMFAERQITLQLEGGWHRSVVFNIDQIGVFNMEVKRRINLATIPHVNTRGAPEYTEVFPAMRTLGLYFETDWGEENIVVKSFQKGSYASTKTDIKVGDVLMSIDDEPVDGKQFELAMVLLRNKLSTDGCVVKFRTIEEKIRLIRESALNSTVRSHRTAKRRIQGAPGNTVSNSGNHNNSMPDLDTHDDVATAARHEGDHAHGGSNTSHPLRLDMDTDIGVLEERIQASRHSLQASSRERAREKDRIVLRVELRQVEASAMILVQELGPKVNAEYRIENKSVCYKLYYKQKGIAGNSWMMLNPGQSRSYVWEDPFQPHKLLVHSGDNVLSPSNNLAHISSEQAGTFLTKRHGEAKYWGYLAGRNADQATVVNLDEIGSKETLFVSKQSDLKMVATVKSEGPTKILLITPALENRQVIRELRYTSEFINQQLNLLNQLMDKLTSLAKYSTVGQLSSKLALLDSQFEDALVRMKEKQTKLLEVDEALNSSGNSVKAGPAQPRGSFGGKKGSPGGEEAADTKPALPLTSLLSFRPIERVMEAGIDRQHQLEISVLEAKELTALVAGKREDVYCKVVIKSEDLTVMTQSRYNKVFRTYVCDSTLDPNWLEQKFVFDVPERAVLDQRKYNVKVLVKARSIVGLDTTLGQTDIEFSCLKEERPLEGWFPLRAVRSSSVLSLKVSGSVKLRLQWVHSPVGFAHYMCKALEERQHYLKLQYNVQRFSLKHLQKVESNKSLTAKNDKIQRMQLRQAEKDYYELFEALSDREKAAKIGPAPFQALLLQQSQKVPPLGLNLSNVAMDIESELTPVFPGHSGSGQHGEPPENSEDGKEDDYESDHELGKNLQLDDFINGRESNHTRAVKELNANSAKFDASIMSPINTTDLHSPMQGGSGSHATHGHAGHGANAHSEIASVSFLNNSNTVGKSALKDGKFRPPKINTTTPSNSVGRNPKFRRGLSSKFDEEGSGSSHVLKVMPNAVHEYDDHHHAWALASLNNIPIHQAMAESMDRSEDVAQDHQAFCRRFDQECRRSFEHVHTMTGTLEVTPMQALHLPEAKDPMLVRVAYGDQRHSTFRLPPASYLTWYQEQDAGAGGATHAGLHNPDFAENGGSSAHTSFNRDRDSSELNSPIGATPPQRDNSQNATLAKTFDVDTLNIKGALKVFIMTEGVLKAQEVAKIEIPMFNLLDCCFPLTEGQYYDRWFPLILSSESMPCEGDVDRYMNNIIPEQSAYSSFDYQPCVRLRVRWIHSDNRHQIEESRLYARFQVPSVSFGLIDSVYAREVMQVAIRGIEFRHSVATDYTDSSLNITSMQVDNQLPDPVSAVILCPTRVKHPQPVVRLHVRKKNLLSQHHLTSYKTIQLIVQELDLHLEQQTVIASWELVKSLMQERKYGKQQSQVQNSSANKVSSEGGSTNMDLLGFATCTALVQYELLPTLSETFGKKQSSKNAGPDKKESTLNHDEDVNTLYIEHFEIFPIKVNVSFITTPQVNLAPQQKKQRETDIRSEGTTGMYSSVSLFLWQVGEVVLDLTSTISDAPIFFHGYEESHVFKTDHEIARFLQDRYLHYAMWQLYKIVGSLDLVGNPISLLSSLGSGVRDFFYKPAHAIITSPTEIRKIGAGIVKGAVSLVSNTTVGFLGTGITITRSIGRGVAKLSVDSAYMRRREELQRVPATIKAAAKRPFLDFYNGFYYGLVGVVKIPVKTVRRRGAIGVVPGVAKGLLGLATNPVVGTLDAIAHAGDACRDMLNLTIKEPQEPVLRLRLSELFGPDGRILPYNFPNALGTQILLVLDRSKEERIKVSSAINSGVGMIHSVFSRNHGDTISMSTAPNQQSARLSVLNDRRGSILRQNSRGEPISVSGKPLSASGKGNMVQRKNRFSFHTTNEEEAVLRSDMGMFAHTMSQAADDASVESDGDKDHHKAPEKSEFVIYTAIIKQDRNLDLIAILTTERIIVTEYHRRPNSAYLKEQWVSPLTNVQVPIFERSGGKATLLLRSSSSALADSAATTKKMHHDALSGRSSISELPDSTNGPRSPLGFNDASSHMPLSSQHSSTLQAGKKTSNYLLVANYNEEDVIINLHNCILAVRGYFDGLMPTYVPEHNDCEEKEQNVIHIGPWQFARDVADNPNNYGQSLNAQMDTKAAETQAIIKELELEVWVHWKKPRAESRDKAPFALQLSNKNKDLDAPLWLTAEQEAAVQSHSNIRHIFELCNRLYEEYKRQPRSKYLLKVSIQELYKGGIDYETFMKNTQPAIMPAAPPKPAPADDESVDSTATGKKAKSRFSLFPFVLGGNSNNPGIASGNASLSGVESNAGSTATKRSHIISFNLPRGMGGKADESKNNTDESAGAPHSPVPGFTAPAENEDQTAFGVMSDISSRLTAGAITMTAGAMTIGAAALALPSSLAYSMARSNSPAPTGTTKVKEIDTNTDRIVEGEGEEPRAATHIPFGLSPLNSSERSNSWDTMEMAGTPHGDLNNLNNLFSTKEQRQREKEASEFFPTVVSANSSVSGQSVNSAPTLSSQNDSSFTYADLKPNRRRHSSPKLGAKNSVRWSTGNLTGGGHDGSREELETILEGINERPSSKSRTSRRSTGSAEDGIATLSPATFMSVRSKTSSFDTDDEAMFFDALSPTDLINESFDDFEAINKTADSTGFGPVDLTGDAELGDSPSSPHSPNGSPREPLMLTSPQEEGANGESDEVGSNISTTSSHIAMDNPMFHHGVSPAAATLLASSLTGGYTTHPLRRNTSFGRPRPSLEGKLTSESQDAFFSPIPGSGVPGVHRRKSFGMELVAREAATGVAPGYIAPHQTPIAPHQHRTPPGLSSYQSPTAVQSPEITAMAERLERLENLLVQALGSKDTTPLQPRRNSAEQSSSVERPGSANRNTLTHQLSTSFAQYVAPMLGLEASGTSEAEMNSPGTLSRSSSHDEFNEYPSREVSNSEDDGFGNMDYFSPARDASLTISSKGGDPVSDADFDAWERSQAAWASSGPIMSTSTDASFPAFERAAESTETFRSGFLMSSSDDDSFRPTGVREPSLEVLSDEEEVELDLMREEDSESAVRELDETQTARAAPGSDEASLPVQPEKVSRDFAFSADTQGTFDLSSSDGADESDNLSPEFASSFKHMDKPSQNDAVSGPNAHENSEPVRLANIDEVGVEEGTTSAFSISRRSLPTSPLTESPMPDPSGNQVEVVATATSEETERPVSNVDDEHKPRVSDDEDASPRVVNVTPSAIRSHNSTPNGHVLSDDELNGHKSSPIVESNGHSVSAGNGIKEDSRVDVNGDEDAPPTSPSVAVLIDRFSSPLITRSSDRESRRLSRRRDSTG